MPAPTSVFDVELRTSVTGLHEVVRDIENSVGDVGIGLGLTSDSMKQLADLQKKIGEGVSEGFSSGFAGLPKGLEKMLLKMVDNLFDSVDDQSEESAKKASKIWGKGFTEWTDKWTSKVGGFIEGLPGKLSTPGGIMGMVSGGAKAAGAGMMGKGAKLQEKYADAEGMGKVMGSMGKLMSKLGPAVAALGSVASLIGSVIALLIEADSEVKDFNKALFDSGVTVGDMGAKLGGVSKALEGVQDATYDWGNNVAWGTMPQDQAKILAAFNAQGHTLAKMVEQTRELGSEMASYQKATATALTYARLFGKSAEEIATDQAKYMEEQGGTLKQLEASYAGVYQAAMTSGFGTKRFYTMVLQATSGLSMYNVRMEEASGLMMMLSKVMSPENAAAFLQTLTKGFAGESMVDRYKRVMTTGTKKTHEIVMNSAANMAKGFAQKFEGSAPALSKAFSAAAPRLGADFALDLDSTKGQKEMIKTLAGMSPKEQTKMLAKVRAIPGQEKMAQNLSSLVTLARGTKGGMTNLAKSLEGLDMGGKLAMSLSQGMGVFGKPLHELAAQGGPQLAAWEAMTGISGEQRVELERISEALYGNFGELQDLSKNTEAAAAQTEQQRADQLKQFGAFVDADGKIMTGALDENGKIIQDSLKPIEDMEDYLQSQGDRIAEDMKGPMDKNIALAMEISQNTLKMTQILEMGVKFYLKEISQMIGGLLGDVTGVDPKAVATAMEISTKKTEKWQAEAQKAQQELIEVERNLATGEITKEQGAEMLVAAKENLRAANAGIEMEKGNREQLVASIAAGSGAFEDASAYSAESVSQAINVAYANEIKELEKLEKITREGTIEESVEAGKRWRELTTELGGDPRLMADAISESVTQAVQEGGRMDDPGILEDVMKRAWRKVGQDLESGKKLNKSMEQLTAVLPNLVGTASEDRDELTGWRGMLEAASMAGGDVIEDVAPASPLLGAYESYKSFSEGDYMGGALTAAKTLSPVGALETGYNLGEGVLKGIGLFDDFIWRAGESPIRINPNDNLVGTKDPGALGVGDHTMSMGEQLAALPSPDAPMVDDYMRVMGEGMAKTQAITAGAGLAPLSPESSERGLKEQSEAMFGKPLHELSSMEKAAFEEMTGVSQANLEILEGVLYPQLQQPDWVRPTQEGDHKFLKDLSRKELDKEGDLLDQQAKDIAKETVEEETKARAFAMAQAKFGGEVPDDVRDAIEKGDFAGGIMPADLFNQLAASPILQDFVLRPGSEPFQFSSRDTLIGAKEGGPLLSALENAGRGGGGGSVSIKIVHPDRKMVYDTTIKALKDTGLI
jgi:hypothetical protein